MFFTIEKIEKQLPEIRQAIARDRQAIPRFKFLEGDCPGAQAAEFDDRAWADFNVGETWGGYDITAWFRARVPIPLDWTSRKLALHFLVGPRDGGGSTAESLLYVDGRPLQGIDVWHEQAWLPRELAERGEIQVALKAWSGVLEVPERRRFKLAELLWIDEPTECFYYLAQTLVKAAKVLDDKDLRRVRILQALDDAFRRIDFLEHGSESFYQSVAAAEQFLQARVAQLRRVKELKPHITAVGHSHLDMAWLWRLKDTKEKAARTWATALHLMRQYPEYRFLHSSPQLYEYIKRDHPEIFEQVKERVASGQWEISGATWVEPDTNVPGGESLVRQLLFGKRYVREEFGVDSTILWLPDVFGYSYALPQILARSGIKYFMTTKLSWNQFNRFPYDTFRWRGLDGSEVLAHFVTAPEEHSTHYAYIGALEPFEVKGIWDNYAQKEVNDDLLFLYGWGDGGGGPTQEMLESARVLSNLPGLPSLELGKAESYFARLEERLKGQELPVWDGELYLEYHRGTYTSQAWVKRANRQAEILFHDAEWLAAQADVLTRGDCYPVTQLREGWELILLNQFHDILPGSSIRQVYEDCRADYARVFAIGADAVQGAQRELLPRIRTESESIVVFNSFGQERTSLLELPWSPDLEGRTIQNPDGTASPTQVVTRGGETRLLVTARAIPALGYAAYPLVAVPAETEAEPTAAPFIITPKYLSGPYYEIELNDRGQIVSLYDRVNARQVLAPEARGNVFQAFEDKPMNFDAWDIDIYYQDKQREVDQLVEAVVEEAGPLRGVLRLTWKLNGSTLTQRLVLYANSPRIDFETEADWHQQQILLKVAFPVDVRATRAAYDIQFGNIERATHWNTSWDYARFETVGHKWADLSEGNYGVALLNDCKYGYDVKDNVLRLTLIKSAVRPDPTADQGRHVFTYSLLPHARDWRQGRVVSQAYDLNYPPRHERIEAQPGGKLAPRFSFVSCSAEHVLVETVKRAEGERAWIVRVYEFGQSRANQVALRFGRPVSEAVECNLIEEGEEPVTVRGNEIFFSIAPYEIKTFKVWF